MVAPNTSSTQNVVAVLTVTDATGAPTGALQAAGQTFGQALTVAQAAAAVAGVSAMVAAPATLDSTNAATYAGATVSLAAAATITVAGTAWAGLDAGLIIQVGQSGSATLAFSASAVKENASGTSGASVTLSASGVYVLTKSPSGTPIFRLTGGASL